MVVTYTGLPFAFVRVRLFCCCMEAPRMCAERSWHREEVEVLTDDEAARLIEQHQCEGSAEK